MKRLSDKARREHDRANLEAEERLAALTPEDSDNTIAEVTADYLLSIFSSPTYRLMVLHDTSKRVAQRAKLYGGALWEFHTGPCLLDFDWSRKGAIGIKTTDRERAREWLLWAFALGYSPFVQGQPGNNGCGQGSIGAIRKRMEEEVGRFAKAAASQRAERKAML